MFLIVGLGNPGKEYSSTRHNIGFRAVDILSELYHLDFQNKSKFNAQIALGDCALGSIILCKPETYMNLSGETVHSLSSYYKITPNKIIVIHDDIDLGVGQIKYKLGGGAAGHNGLKSIDRHIGLNYHRIRIGVGRPKEASYEISDYVLGKFSRDEEPIILNSIDLISKKIGLLIEGDIEGFKKEIAL